MKKAVVQENLLAIGIALILSAIVFFAVENSSILTADITGSQVEFSAESDLVSYVENDELLIAASKSYENVASVSMLVFFDPDTAKIERDAIASSYNISYTPANEGRASLTVSGDIGALAVGDTLAELTVIGEVRDVTISDIVMTFDDGSTASLSLSVQ